MGLVVAVLVGLFCAFLGLGFVLQAAGYANPGDSAGVIGNVVGAVISFAVAVGCLVWGVHLEHRLRSHQPHALAYQPPPPLWATALSRPVANRPPAYQTPAYRPSSYGRRSGRRGRYGPGVGVFALLLWGAVFAGFLIGTVRLQSEAARSADVQQHGIAASGLVLDVHNHSQADRSGVHYNADVTVILSEPVLHRATTVVRYPARFDGQAGEAVNVLVDPHDPGYAEFPGSPDTTNWGWIVTAFFAAFVGLILFAALKEGFHLGRHRRRMRAGPPPEFGTSSNG